MESLAIIKSFDKRKDLSAGLVSRVIGLTIDEFILQRAEEALGQRVVVAIAMRLMLGIISSVVCCR